MSAARAERRRTAAVNRARGETVLQVGEREIKLCLTLAAIAEIEDGLNLDGLHQIEAALQTAGSRQFATILSALARGAGEDVTVEDARRWPITLGDASAAIVAAFQAAGAAREPDSGNA